MKPRHSLSLTLLAALCALPTVACEAIAPPGPKELDLWSDASGGVASPLLAKLSSEYWEHTLRWNPFWATSLGDPRYDGKIPREDPRSDKARAAEVSEMRLKLRSMDRTALGPEDLLTWELLDQEMEKELARITLDLGSWTVDPLEGPHIVALNLVKVQKYASKLERVALVERWRQLDTYVRQASLNLERGRREGRVASRTAVQKTIEQLGAILDVPPMDSPLVAVATGGGRWVALPPNGSVAEVAHDELGDARDQRLLRQVNLHLQDGERLVIGTRVLVPAEDDPLGPEERGVFLNDVLTAVEDHVYPALAGYRDYLVASIVPIARSDTRPGLAYVAGGESTYRRLIREHTSLPLAECDPRAIHEFGLAEIARIRAEISELGAKALGTDDVARIQEQLRNDPALHFSTREEVEEAAVVALERARVAMPRFFGILPAAECVVTRIPAFEEANSTTAYYNQPDPNGGRPGRYYVNTYRPETRPRYEAEVLAYHESIPGHHLQIAIAQERDNLPLFRRHLGSTAFVEGWALYTERLADEMGLYSSDLDRFGMLSYDAWRASRLVVDTGLHAFGWSRDQGIAYMVENTLLSRQNIENEVDRYIAWPGQALAYKIGQREILALRDQARAARGAAFSWAEFHDRILENGAVSLPALRGVIGRWLAG